MRNVYIVYSNARTFKVVVADTGEEAQEIAGYGEAYQVSLGQKCVVETGSLD